LGRFYVVNLRQATKHINPTRFKQTAFTLDASARNGKHIAYGNRITHNRFSGDGRQLARAG
jgi:hypothetical protein